MEWLTPLTALFAALVTVPLLLLLYFLKLKRLEHVVSSTLLWKRAIRDLQVNAPFQKLRHNILLLLQLLMLFAILLAIAWPILSLVTGSGRRYVLLIDRSASMSTIDDDNSGQLSRLDKAKEQARVFAETMRNKAVFSLKDDSDQTMVIAFDDHAKVMCNFTSDKRQLLTAIESITPSHGKSTLSEAVVVARAFSQAPGDEADYINPEELAQLMLFSDGQISDLHDLILGEDEIIYHSIGQSDNNVAITAMQALRSYENPDEVEVFVSVSNFSQEQVTADLQLSINNDVKDIKQITIPAAVMNDEIKSYDPGRIAVNFSLSEIQEGILEIRQLYKDCLACDDAAWAILSPPEKLSVLLVTADNIALESALKACPLAQLNVRSPAQFDAMDHSEMTIEQPYDVIILDGYTPEQLPKGRYLIFGEPPNDIEVSVSEQLENQIVIDWRQNHPVLKYVDLTNLFAAKCYKMEFPRDADIIAEFNETEAMAIVQRNGSVFLLAGFSILETNWPFEPSFVLFCYNATNYLGIQVGQQKTSDLIVGEPIVVEGLEPGIEAKITGPDNNPISLKSNPSGNIRYANTYRVGRYSLEISDQPARFYTVNLLDAQESDINPVQELDLSNLQVEAQEETIGKANVPLWPFLVGLALILACVEWLVYNYKVRI